MPFDPDKYLAEKEGGASASSFDPDAYLASRAAPVAQQGRAAEGVQLADGTIVPKWALDNPTLYGIYGAARETLGLPLKVAGGIAGAAAGGAAGAPAGPLGVAAGGIAGGTTGYATAAQLLRKADEALGTVPPPQTVGQAFRQAGSDVLEGAENELLGRAIQPVVAPVLRGAEQVIRHPVESARAAGQAVKGAYEFAKAPLDTLATRKAGKIAQEAIGGKGALVQEALAEAPADVTTSQALARKIDPKTGLPLNVPEAQAMLKVAETGRPARFTDIAQGQEASRAAKLAGVAKGATQTEAAAAEKAARSELNELTTPMREAAIAKVNDTGGADITPITAQIRDIMVNPKNIANKEVQGVLSEVLESLTKHADDAGKIDAYTLNDIRTNTVGAASRKVAGSADPTTAAKLAAKVEKMIKGSVDDAMGPEYKEYLKTHSAGMQEIGKTKLGAEAMDLYRTSPEQFVNLVRGNNKELVEKILGPGTYDIAQGLSNKAMDTLKGVAKEVEANLAASEQATAGQKKLMEIIKNHSFNLRIPGFMSIAATAPNAAIDQITKRVGKRAMEKLADAALNANNMKELLAKYPPAEKARLLQGINNPKNYSVIEKATARALPSAVVELKEGGDINNMLSSRRKQNNLMR